MKINFYNFVSKVAKGLVSSQYTITHLIPIAPDQIFEIYDPQGPFMSVI